MATAQRQAADRKTDEEAVADAIKKQTDALREQQALEADIKAAAKGRRGAEERLAQAKEEGAELAIDLAVKRGEMSPEQGAAAKAKIEQQYDREKFIADQKAKQSEIDQVLHERSQAQAELMIAKRQVEEAKRAREAAEQALDQARERTARGRAAAEDASDADSALADARERAKEEARTTGTDPEAFPYVKEAEERAKAADAAAAAALKEKGPSVDQATKAYQDQAAQVQALTENLKAAQAESDKTGDYSEKVALLIQQVTEAKTLQDQLEQNAGIKGDLAQTKDQDTDDKKAREEKIKELEMELALEEKIAKSRKGYSPEEKADARAKAKELQDQISDRRNFGDPGAASRQKAINDGPETPAPFDFVAGILPFLQKLGAGPWNDDKRIVNATQELEAAVGKKDRARRMRPWTG